MSETRPEHNDNEHISNDLETKIQDEIRRRIVEKEHTIQEEKQRQLHTQATLDALGEVAEISSEEAQKIARQVREEYTRKHARSAARNKIIRRSIGMGSIVIAIFILIIGGIQYNKRRLQAKISYRTAFTTALDSHNYPVNNLREISIQEDRIYLCIFWRFLPKGKHHYRIQLFDGSGAQVWSYEMTRVNNDEEFNSWFWYPPKETIDIPGRWRFEIFLDGKKTIEEHLSVVPGSP